MTPTLPADADDWVTAWRDRLNDSAAFVDAAEGFEAAVLLVVEPDETYDGDPVHLLADVADGECVTARAVDRDGGADRAADPVADGGYDYALRGPYEAWKSILTEDVDVEREVLDGPFDVEGNTVALLKHRAVFVEMVRAGRAVDVTFAH